MLKQHSAPFKYIFAKNVLIFICNAGHVKHLSIFISQDLLLLFN